MPPCPACGGPLERWRTVPGSDPALPGDYALDRCRACGTAVTLAPVPDEAHESGAYGGGAPRLSRARRADPAPVRPPAPRRSSSARARRRRGACSTSAPAAGASSPMRAPPAGTRTGSSRRSAASTAPRRSGIELVHADIRNADVPPGSLDAATLWHVLEHVDDPGLALEWIARLAAAGRAAARGRARTSRACRRGSAGRAGITSTSRATARTSRRKGLEALLRAHGFEPVALAAGARRAQPVRPVGVVREPLHARAVVAVPRAQAQRLRCAAATRSSRRSRCRSSRSRCCWRRCSGSRAAAGRWRSWRGGSNDRPRASSTQRSIVRHQPNSQSICSSPPAGTSSARRDPQPQPHGLRGQRAGARGCAGPPGIPTCPTKTTSRVGSASMAASAPPGRGAARCSIARASAASSWWPAASRRSIPRRARARGEVAALGEDQHRAVVVEVARHRRDLDLDVAAARVDEAIRQPPAEDVDQRIQPQRLVSTTRGRRPWRHSSACRTSSESPSPACRLSTTTGRRWSDSARSAAADSLDDARVTRASGSPSG